MRSLLRDDPRFKFEAYQFIREALHYASTQSTVAEAEPAMEMEIAGVEAERSAAVAGAASPQHVTGGQLCYACRDYALQQYGALAPLVLGSWGVRSTGDLGELVYNLIRIEQMRKSESDRREHFDDVFDFGTAFEPCFEQDDEETMVGFSDQAEPDEHDET